MRRILLSIRSPSRLAPLHWVLVGLGIIPLDYATGPYLDSMVLLYPLPAAMAAWSEAPAWSLALAIGLPPIRLLIFHWWGWPVPGILAVLDTVVMALVSVAVAFLILQLRHQARTLRVLEGMLPICGFCKRIRNGEKWETLEGFISDHSEARFSHTFCPSCGLAHYGERLMR
ncbi:MAG TPA: hypothetical protein VFK09_11880 [Gemmatimonadales bacterium]|nr:hypothetical protein [Gemmatimonadales bacterium]